MENQDELTTIITVMFPGKMARYDALLNGTGIFYTWKGATANTLGVEATGLSAGIQLQVRADDYAGVEEILKEAEADNESIERLSEISLDGKQYIHADEYCPECDNFGVYMEHGSVSKRIGYLFKKRKRHCTACKAEW